LLTRRNTLRLLSYGGSVGTARIGSDSGRNRTKFHCCTGQDSVQSVQVPTMLYSGERKNLQSRDESFTRKTPVGSRAPHAKGCGVQTAYGNQAVLRMLSLARTGPQAKLSIRQPGDGLAVPADRAEPALSIARPGDALVQRKCGCEAGAKEVAVGGDMPHPEEAQPCGDCTCPACAEKKHIHTKGTRPASASNDNHVVPAEGQYAPDTSGGRILLAHELAHVIQQNPARGNPTYSRAKLSVRSSGDLFEPAADRVAENVMRMPVASTLPAHDTYTFLSRGSYGDTTPGFTPPSCAAAAAGASSMVAGSAAPNVSVYPNGTYQVTRNDGVVKTATCTRLAAGLAATRAHENSHAAGARAAATAANTAAALPQNFATPALCTAALPGVLAAWNASVNAAWANEVSHGPGTNPPTAQTFTQENAAGTCTFT
jgi:hypothetical protein